MMFPLPFFNATILAALGYLGSAVLGNSDRTACSQHIFTDAGDVVTKIESCPNIVLDYHSLLKIQSNNKVDDITKMYAGKHQKVQLKTGELPKLKKLRELHISYNKVVKFERESFDYLNDLQKLNLAYNNIGTIPLDLFRNLPSLEMLRLTGNKLVVFNGNHFNHLNRLKVVYMENNKITTITGKIDRPMEIYLNDNKLSKVKPTHFDGYNREIIFIMWGNNITEDVTKEIEKRVWLVVKKPDIVAK